MEFSRGFKERMSSLEGGVGMDEGEKRGGMRERGKREGDLSLSSWGQSSAGRRGSWQDTAEGDCGNLHRITGVSDAL